MRKYISKQDFEKIQIDSKPKFSRIEYVLYDEPHQPVYVYNSNSSKFEELTFEKIVPYLKYYGAALDGIQDDSSALNNAFASIATSAKRKTIVFPDNVGTIKINSGIVINFNQLSIDFNGTTLDASGMSSGYAVTLTGQNVLPYNIQSNVNKLRGLVLIGPDTDATTVDGLRIGGIDTSVPGHGSIEDIFIRGFRDNLVLEDNYYISTYRNLHSMYAHRYGLNYVGDSNTGESISFFGGGFLDCQNSGETSIGIFVPSSAAGPDLFFFGTSFSYNDIAFDIQAGSTNFMSCHFESKTNNPMGKMKYVGGRPSVSLVLSGGSLAHGTLGSGTENANGRPYMFFIDNTTGDRCSCTIRDLRYNGFGKKETEFVRFTGNAYPLITLEGIELAASGGAVGRLCEYTNMLYNAGFETGKTNGWTNSDGTNTVTRDTTVFNTDAAGSGGAASLKIVGASAGTTVYSQTLEVSPGDKVLARGFARIDSVSAGNLTIKLYLLDQTDTTITTYTLGTMSAVTAFTLYGNFYRVTAGIKKVKFEIAATGFTGTGYFDDCGVWVL